MDGLLGFPAEFAHPFGNVAKEIFQVGFGAAIEDVIGVFGVGGFDGLEPLPYFGLEREIDRLIVFAEFVAADEDAIADGFKPVPADGRHFAFAQGAAEGEGDGFETVDAAGMSRRAESVDAAEGELDEFVVGDLVFGFADAAEVGFVEEGVEGGEF